MQNNYSINFGINKLFRNVKLKKQYVKNLRNKVSLLSNVKEKNYKFLNCKLPFQKRFLIKYDNLVTYIIDISFLRSNTFFHILDFFGNLRFFYSAGSFNYSGKNKKVRRVVFKEFYRMLLKLKFLKNKPLALHFKNVGSNNFWIIKILKKKFFIKIIRNFNLYPHNGCRKRKMRRKKFKKKRKEEMAERFKAADCKSVEFSHRRFESYFLQIF